MTNQPQWKYVGHTGDVDPIAYGGSFVYVDETGVYPPEMTWFEPATDDQWKQYVDADKEDELPVLEFRVMLENKPENEWWYEKLPELVSYTGIPLEDMQAFARSENVLQRALVYESLIHYYGAEEFDSYPVTRTQGEAYQKYAEEMKAR